MKLLADLMRMRAAQVTAVAAVLLGLVALGRHDDARKLQRRRSPVTARQKNSYSKDQHRSRRGRTLVEPGL